MILEIQLECEDDGAIGRYAYLWRKKADHMHVVEIEVYGSSANSRGKLHTVVRSNDKITFKIT